MNEPQLQVAHIAPCTEAEGPGKRFALWFQGCPLRCPGCCNPEYLSFTGGTQRPLAAVIAKMRAEPGIEGITLLGGEPFAHAPAAVQLARAAREHGLSVMIFSGYTLEELRARPEPEVGELLALTDILVDGPYLREQPDTERRWIGSRNQRIHFLTERYRADDPCWREKNTLEIRVRGGDVTVNGYPAQASKGLWKGWKKKHPTPLPPPRSGEGEREFFDPLRFGEGGARSEPGGVVFVSTPHPVPKRDDPLPQGERVDLATGNASP